MIKYLLKCKKKHEFESWFLDSGEYERLKKKNLLECIFCKSKNVKKSIMAPRIIGSNKEDIKRKDLIEIKKNLLKVRKFVEANFTNVGSKFAEKIRDVYYEKDSKQDIFGTTTAEERKELKDEGIELTSIPWVDKEN